jgi:hypothetical protein
MLYTWSAGALGRCDGARAHTLCCKAWKRCRRSASSTSRRWRRSLRPSTLRARTRLTSSRNAASSKRCVLCVYVCVCTHTHTHTHTQRTHTQCADIMSDFHVFGNACSTLVFVPPLPPHPLFVSPFLPLARSPSRSRAGSLSQPLSLARALTTVLSLPLSLTHTHIRTRAHTQDFVMKRSMFPLPTKFHKYHEYQDLHISRCQEYLFKES